MYRIADMLLRLMAPILSFTADEAWAVLHPGDPSAAVESVLFHTWIDVFPVIADEPALLSRWARIRAIRGAVQKELERLREAREIGSSLQAEVILTVPAKDMAIVEGLGNDLRFVLITSAAQVQSGAELQVTARPSAERKCERCWHYRSDIGFDPSHPNICGRCVANLSGVAEERIHA